VFGLNCKLWKEQLVLHSYDELEAEAREALVEHLQTCSDCQQFQERLNETWRALDSWEEVDCPMNIRALHEATRPKPLMAHLPWHQRWFSWGLAAGLILLVGFSTLAWVGVDITWKDNGLTIRLGPEEVPEFTKADVIQLLQAQRQAARVEVSNQLQSAFQQFSEQLRDHLNQRQQQMNAQIALIYQAIQSQRAGDLELVRQELQKLAGATEAELIEANRAIGFILASRMDGTEQDQKP